MNLQTFIAELIAVVNNIIIPAILGIAFLFFVINVFRFFIVGGSTEDGREKSKQLAIYSVAAFAFILIFWGIVNMFASSIGLSFQTAGKSDYVDINDGGTNTPSYCPPGQPGPC